MGFEKIVISGLGLIGGSFAAAVRHRRIPVTVVGVDREPVITAARRRGLIAEGFCPEELARAAKDADLIVLAMPISQILQSLSVIAAAVQPGTLVTDVGSTKARIVAEAEKRLPEGVYFLGGHPMTGSERRGLQHADPFLFENAAYVLTGHETVAEERLQAFVRLLEAIGARPVFLTAEAHDAIAAAVSHLPQILAVTLMNYVAELNGGNPDYLTLAAGGFRDMTRIAASPFDIWQDILASNRENIATCLREFVLRLSKMEARLNKLALQEQFEEAARAREAIPRRSPGLLGASYEITVVAADRPGAIAEIAGALAAQHINIQDIEIMRVREGEAGTIKLALESEEARDLALSALQEKGLQAFAVA